MHAAPTCFEIVQFAFRGDVPLPSQIESMQRLRQWAARQLGYRTRQSYHDPVAEQWIDIVEWDSLENALAAMERSRLDASLAGLMALIDPESVRAGHFEPMTSRSPAQDMRP